MYTVKQLSNMSGLTPRALHYYDQIGLLKPSRVGENGYRYYSDEALLRLQQILLYRELGLPLEKIRLILGRREYAVLPELEKHRLELSRRIRHLERLIDTVDHTILHLKGEREMSTKQLFEGFSDEQQAAYEQEAMQKYDPQVVKSANRKWKNYSPAEKQRILDEGNQVYQEMIAAMPKGPASPDVQAAVEHWRRHLDYFWTPPLEALTGLADLYNEDPRFKANFDKVDPRLAAFMRQAVEVYVNQHTK